MSYLEGHIFYLSTILLWQCVLWNIYAKYVSQSYHIFMNFLHYILSVYKICTYVLRKIDPTIQLDKDRFLNCLLSCQQWCMADRPEYVLTWSDQQRSSLARVSLTNLYLLFSQLSLILPWILPIFCKRNWKTQIQL